MLVTKIKQRLSSEEGFTLIELLVVIIIIGILMAIAIPSYLGFRDKANQRAASADVRSAIPATTLYYNDNNDSYTGMTQASLLAYDAGLKLNNTVKVTGGGTGFCLDMTVGGKSSYFAGPGSAGIVENALCP